jgi:hypothetical protein
VDENASIGLLLQGQRAESGIAPNGGTDDRWVVVRLGRVPMPFPNTRARRRALDLHDVNHLLAGFHTDNVGEGEISAWELGSGGCGRYLTAWVLDLAGLLLILVWPQRISRAFRLGRLTKNVYGFDIEVVSGMKLGELRRNLTREPLSAPLSFISDMAWLGIMLIAAIPAGAALLLLVILTTPIWAVTKQSRRLKL